MEDSKMEKITSQMSKGSVLYVGSDALSLDGGSTPKVGDEVTVTGKVKSIEDKTVCIAPSLVGNEGRPAKRGHGRRAAQAAPRSGRGLTWKS